MHHGCAERTNNIIKTQVHVFLKTRARPSPVEIAPSASVRNTERAPPAKRVSEWSRSVFFFFSLGEAAKCSTHNTHTGKWMCTGRTNMAATPGDRTFFFLFCPRFLFLCSTAVGSGGGGCRCGEKFPGSGSVQQSGDESPRGRAAAFPFSFCECRRFGRTVGKTLVSCAQTVLQLATTVCCCCS